MIDAHIHFWDWQLERYDWITDEMEAIRRPFSPAHLAPCLAASGVESAVLVQTCSSLEETRRFLALADVTAFVGGVVGWVDLTDPRAADAVAALRDGPGGRFLVGIRHQVHDEPDPAWLLRGDVRRGLAAVAAAGLAYDLLVRSRELPAALELARELPDLRLVIDHLAKPPLAGREIEPWAALMAPFADLEQVSCKVSGLVTEADWRCWSADEFVPYVDRIAGWFGEDRLLFGSDWPVCTLAARYDEVVRAYAEVLRGLSRDKVFRANAVAVYRLP